ncbi:hypothetical protein FACS1894111_13430 [Clostridia bacterium]|nr:hypothetical protein FACS1894111_13430 [Clostridia bacterium]
MPQISLFFGIKITMNWNEHNPPHFHVEYADYKASVLILEGVIGSGHLPNRQLKYVLTWCELHQDELMQNWELSRQKQPLHEIAPL